jgi:hypothetical protein
MEPDFGGSCLTPVAPGATELPSTAPYATALHVHGVRTLVTRLPSI